MSGTSMRLDIRIGMTIAEAERQLILATLAGCNGNPEKAAKILGCSARTIYNKLLLYRRDGTDSSNHSLPPTSIQKTSENADKGCQI
jgi:DNA-binding NtrC family response regulator